MKDRDRKQRAEISAPDLGALCNSQRRALVAIRRERARGPRGDSPHAIQLATGVLSELVDPSFPEALVRAERTPKTRRNTLRADQYPHIPCTPPPGGVEDEHRKTFGSGVE